MSIRILVFVLTALLTLSACGDKKEATSSSVATAVNIEKPFPFSIQKGGFTKDLGAIRAEVRTLLDHRAQTQDAPLAMMTVPYWAPEVVFDGSKFSKEFEYDGYWIKYNDDFTYTYGKYADVYGSGRYHFRLDDKALLLLDDDVEMEPKSFTGNYNGEIMAYIGKHDYGVNNGFQVKMVPYDNQPLTKILR